MDTSIQTTIDKHVRHKWRGKVFTPKDLLHIGGREAVDKALSRLVKEGVIQRMGRGLYCYPQFNKRLNIAIPPAVDEIADALARQTGSRIAPSGATAANQLGLSTQIPAKPVYLTDGRSRRVKVGSFLITVRHVPPKELPIGNRTSAKVLQALRYLGKDAVDAMVLKKVRATLTAKQQTRLLHDARYTTDWIADAVRTIAGADEAKLKDG